MSKNRTIGNKNKDPKPAEAERAHPRHAPYQRERYDWHNLLLDDDSEKAFEDDDDDKE